MTRFADFTVKTQLCDRAITPHGGTTRHVNGDRGAEIYKAAGRRAHPAVPSFQDALTAVLRRRVAQRAARAHGAHPPLVGYLCERYLDAPALLVQPAPWGGEMGVCAACQLALPTDDEASQTR